MPFAVTHVLVPIILVDFIRDHVLKKPKLLPNRYVFLAGVAGLVLDTDLPIVTALNKFFAVGILRTELFSTTSGCRYRFLHSSLFFATSSKTKNLHSFF